MFLVLDQRFSEIQQIGELEGITQNESGKSYRLKDLGTISIGGTRKANSSLQNQMRKFCALGRWKQGKE